MTILQEKKMSMYLVVSKLLALVNPAIINLMPKFALHLAAFNTNLELLQAARETQETDSSGQTVNKKGLKKSLIAKTMNVVVKLKAFALNSELPALAAEVNYSESDLLRSADTILRDQCQVIFSRAEAHAGELEAYGFTALMLTELKAAISAYVTSIPQPKLSINAKKLATGQMNELFKAQDTLLGKLDVLTELVKENEPAFYTNYANSRRIGGPGYRKLAVQGNVTAANSSLPLPGVTIKIEGTALKVKTGAKGNFRVSSLPEGNYVFTFEKNGYQTHTVQVAVTNGERTDLVVKMIQTA
ncbi:MAG: carboxypeptidase-like regulatory domain-containing protein [Daejeonella sp.]